MTEEQLNRLATMKASYRATEVATFAERNAIMMRFLEQFMAESDKDVRDAFLKWKNRDFSLGAVSVPRRA